MCESVAMETWSCPLQECEVTDMCWRCWVEAALYRGALGTSGWGAKYHSAHLWATHWRNSEFNSTLVTDVFPFFSSSTRHHSCTWRMRDALPFRFSFSYLGTGWYKIKLYIDPVEWVRCRHGMARPQVADGGEGLQILEVAAKMLSKKSPTDEKEWSSKLWFQLRTNTSSHYNFLCYETFETSELGW